MKFLVLSMMRAALVQLIRAAAVKIKAAVVPLIKAAVVQLNTISDTAECSYQTILDP